MTTNIVNRNTYVGIMGRRDAEQMK